MIVTAKEAGRRFAIGQIRTGNFHATGNGPLLEDVIFLAMQYNPYISARAREDFYQGASEWVNLQGRVQIRRLNG